MNTPRYYCTTETEKPRILLVHEPGLEARLAFEKPVFWGFDEQINKSEISFEDWLAAAQDEHRQMVHTLRSEGIEVLYLRDLLQGKETLAREYLQQEFRKVKHGNCGISHEIRRFVLGFEDDVVKDPLRGILLGLEASERFAALPSKKKEESYTTFKTLMPQTSLYFMQDPVINAPNGLVKPKMAMWIRGQEPDIVQLALGKENYVHEMKNTTEGGDITLWSYDGKPIMLAGISGASGKNIVHELYENQELWA
ncbi:hypothetical protein HZB01_04595 [Candidatus Woesearchaeota archaeon]|nr:hypothetical protein [Candidatus Woesearchaeota archaeon]